MALGGPMWQKEQARSTWQFGYGKQMRENFVESRRANVAALGNNLFSTKINAGSGQVELAFQLAATRMQRDVAEISKRIDSSINASGFGDQLNRLA